MNRTRLFHVDEPQADPSPRYCSFPVRLTCSSRGRFTTSRGQRRLTIRPLRNGDGGAVADARDYVGAGRGAGRVAVAGGGPATRRGRQRRHERPGRNTLTVGGDDRQG